MDEFKYLTKLPGPPEHQARVRERLETLSVRESYALAAVLERAPPHNAGEAVERLGALADCGVLPAGSYEELGRSYLRQLDVPEDILPHVDLVRLGEMYEDDHPGLFVGSCYVTCPTRSFAPEQQDCGPLPYWDTHWSVKLKLASPAVPQGVWLRLPDCEPAADDHGAGEIAMARRELSVSSLDECALLEARCVLPEAGDLTTQYSSVGELVRDGNDLGYILAERGQGEPHWLEKLAAALEYEGCRTLKLALDIAQNLHCYEWVPGEDLADFAVDRLRDEGVPEALIASGCIDLEGYAEDLLETSGYMLTEGESGYVARNSREFVREYTGPASQTLTMQ